ncbi:MAG: GGDEF domain-containing protein [Lachnospiraceae bacterium]|nr:GGDEF domain-containing protein [Lachnospiraceae bacterium]
MLYTYPPDAAERFAEVFVYRDIDFQKSVDGYLSIINDYANDSGVLAKAYYFLAEAVALQSNFEDCEKYCLLSIEHGKKSGNYRCQNLSTIKLSALKIDQHNEALAAEYLYEGLELIKKNHDEDLYDIIHILLGSLFEKADDYDTALSYFKLSIEELIASAPDAKESSSFAYCARMLAIAECYIKTGQRDDLYDTYLDLQDVPYENISPVFRVALSFLEGYLAYMDGDRERAVTILRGTINDYRNTAEVFDTFFIPENIYRVFESYRMTEDQKNVLDLLKNYCETTDVDTWQFLYTETKIRYCKDIGDKEGLLNAYEIYYSTQQNYHNNSKKQKKEYIKLRKRLYEEQEANQQKVARLRRLSTTDALTGLHNRHAMLRYTPDALQHAIDNQHNFGVLLMDIDCYKQYNDIYGHVQGDECLRTLADILQEVFKDHFCARYGGDEFICIFSDTAQAEISRLCDQLHKAVTEKNLVHSGNSAYGIVTLSIGCSVRVPEPTDDFILFLNEADSCLYKSKKQGRNRTTFYN